MNDLVSVITPTYNAEKFVAETIKSVQEQTHSNWEMLIVDDASSDQTTQLVQEFADADYRIKLIKLNKNSGPAIARNTAITAAKGRYLAFLDADDLWFKFHLTESIEAIKTQNIPFVFASYKRTNERLEDVYSDFIVPQKVTYGDILKSNSISCLTAFIDISVLGKKMMPEIKKRQDMGLWLKYLKIIPFAYGIKKPHAIYRIRENSLSRDKKKLLKSQWYFYRKVEKIPFFKSVYYMLSWMYYGYQKYKN
ncbi:MAG: glycosyltransferase family 2 protein [Bacteroidota bacterium]